MVNRLAYTTTATRRASGGKTVSACLAGERHRSSSRMAGEYNLPPVEARRTAGAVGFEVLHEVSQHTHTKLQTVAEAVIA
ncbi:hypothetical protein ACIPPR_07830 [Streptomyces nigra]|uniref:hypothetical protein n=1 Tax=Streptomyces nigra TaxID=1827580 RepID=UPI003809753B